MKDGLQTFNQLAKEVYKNCNEHGEEFDKAFKKALRKKWQHQQSWKEKERLYWNLQWFKWSGTDDEENSGDEEQEEEWAVSKNVFVV